MPRPHRHLRGAGLLLLAVLGACRDPARFPALYAPDTADPACTPVSWYGDADGDGYGGERFVLEDCVPPEGYVDNDSDCDDLDETTHPGAGEICGDGVDNDCSGQPEDSCLRLLSEGWAIRGERPNEGSFMPSAGDVDGDGVDDVALGIPYSSNAAGQENDGAVAFFFGPHGRDRDLSEADVTIIGSPGKKEVVGWSTLLPGDVDGDGLGDLIVTASQYSTSDRTYAGAVALFSGTTLLSRAGSTDALELGDSDQLWYGHDRRVYFGATIATADVDSDPGTAELISGAPWEDAERGVISILGGTGGDAATSAVASFVGESEGDRLGVNGTVAAADLTGDGVADIAIGVHRRAEDSGGVYLCVGPLSGPVVLADCAARIDAVGTEDQLGRQLAQAGDVDGDGITDLWAVAPDEDSAAIDDGVAYLLLGTAAQDARDAQTVAAAAHAQIRGLNAQDHLGDSTTTGMDIDRDGFSDTLMGASQLGQIEQGVAILFYGPLEGVLPAGAGDAIYTSAESTDLAGEHVAFIRVLDASGQPGIIVDTPEDDQGASNAGAVWLVPLLP